MEELRARVQLHRKQAEKRIPSVYEAAAYELEATAIPTVEDAQEEIGKVFFILEKRMKSKVYDKISNGTAVYAKGEAALEAIQDYLVALQSARVQLQIKAEEF